MNAAHKSLLISPSGVAPGEFDKFATGLSLLRSTILEAVVRLLRICRSVGSITAVSKVTLYVLHSVEYHAPDTPHIRRLEELAVPL